MQYIDSYNSPFGKMMLAADEAGLIGLWFEGQKYFAHTLNKEHEPKKLPIFAQATQWLDIYFSGKKPNFELPLHLIGTDFQNEVWKTLCTIPYGKTMTYGEIAKQLAAKRDMKQMSAQAIGNAVGRNPVAIIVPCHRVIGKNGSLTGYAGGMDKKIELLKLEKVSIAALFMPQNRHAKQKNQKAPENTFIR